jgi:hypothetical protein
MIFLLVVAREPRREPRTISRSGTEPTVGHHHEVVVDSVIYSRLLIIAREPRTISRSGTADHQ